MGLLAGLVRAVTGRRLPIFEGRLAAPGLQKPIEIVRDRWSVPTILAATDQDAWFGAGFALAQDRAGQLELFVRIARGTLSEVAGMDGYPIDRLSRRIGFRHAAERQLKVMRPEIQRQISAYCAGINAGLTLGVKRRAHDLMFLGTKPTLWEPADSHAMSVFLCFALASNWDAELIRFEILHRDGPDALRAVDASYPAHLPTSRPPFDAFGSSAAQLEHDIAALAEVVPLGGASNAWAIAPSRTATGHAILAGDPHLDPAIPCHWYLAHLRGATFHARGAMFAGVAAIAAGHNERLAWSVTAGHADNTDLFYETIGPDKQSILEAGGYVPCEVRRETIHVRGKSQAIVEEVLVTPRGPLIGAALDGAPAGISISATWLAPRPYLGLLGAHGANDVAEFNRLFREGSASQASLISADIEGHIGWQLAVEAPRRKSGLGLVVQAGWRGGWSGELIPFEELPSSVDPLQGFVSTANNAPVPAPYLGVDWLDGYRQRAIVEALGAKTSWDRAATQKLQKNLRSIPWEEMREKILAAPVNDDHGRRDSAFVLLERRADTRFRRSLGLRAFYRRIDGSQSQRPRSAHRRTSVGPRLFAALRHQYFDAAPARALVEAGPRTARRLAARALAGCDRAIALPRSPNIAGTFWIAGKKLGLGQSAAPVFGPLPGKRQQIFEEYLQPRPVSLRGRRQHHRARYGQLTRPTLQSDRRGQPENLRRFGSLRRKSLRDTRRTKRQSFFSTLCRPDRVLVERRSGARLERRTSAKNHANQAGARAEIKHRTNQRFGVCTQPTLGSTEALRS